MISRESTVPASTPTAPHWRAGALGAILAAGLLVMSAGPGRTQADPVIARVNGVEIRQSDLALAEEDLGSNIPPQITGDARRDHLITYLTDIILAAKLAETKKVADTKDFKSRMPFLRNKLLMELMLQSEGKAAATDKAMRDVYAELAKQSTGQEVRARHILVATENEAKMLLAEIKKGTDFAELAKQKSKDPGAAAEGGDLGYFTKEQMVPEFAEAAFKLEKGQLSEPVKTQFGWHLIKVEDKRAKPVPEFDKLKDQIETYVMRKAATDILIKLRAEAKIERLDKK
jgi:peptidyl-prolyl cis-trans isomerase C